MDQDSASASPVAPVPPALVVDTPTPAVPAAPINDDAPIAAALVSDFSTPAPAVDVPAPAPVSDTPVSTPADAPADAPADTPADTPAPAPADAPIDTPAPEPAAPINPEAPQEVAKKIAEAQNVLIALSSDPSVDELSAAIGLSLFLDKLGKRATAIYSGTTPNALEFLKPEETFESNADTLQDFVIALNKEKADHLRYKLDGDYVKIFITPYKSRISSDDLEFSYGDFNIDLVLALDVANGIDLDSALREHGRIMHDAVVVNITTGNPGRFGEIEWSDKTASSVSEMIAKMLYNTDSKDKIEKDEATAFLTGIIAATDRFSNASTTSETMQVASELMQSGADQQLISKNITPDIENEFYSILGGNSKKSDADPTKLDIEHTAEDKDEEAEEGEEHSAEEKTISEALAEPSKEPEDTKEDSGLMDDLKAVEASLSQVGNEAVPEEGNKSVKLEDIGSLTEPTLPTVSPVNPLNSSAEITPEEPSVQEGFISDKPEKVLQPSADANLLTSENSTEKYGKMLEDAIADSTPSQIDETLPPAGANPALSMAPPVADSPEINGVPEINYMPMPGEDILPPPPTPPIDLSVPAESEEPKESEAPATPLGPQPAMQDQVYAPQAVDPNAFKIPGM